MLWTQFSAKKIVLKPNVTVNCCRKIASSVLRKKFSPFPPSKIPKIITLTPFVALYVSSYSVDAIIGLAPWQGCQIVYFETKNPFLYILEGLGMENVFIFYDHLEHFTAKLYQTNLLVWNT
jgi:hypothetical protein